MLRTSQPSEELQALLDAAVDAVIIIDHQGCIEVFNRAAERLFGYTQEEIVGRNVSLLMPEPHRSAHDAYISRYRESGIPHIIGIGREVNAQRRDGTQFPASLAVGRIARSDPPRFVGFVQDITLRREALAALQRERDRATNHLDVVEAALRSQERLTHVARLATMGEMAAGIAHELNQPLAAIANYAQASERLLSRPEPDTDEVRDALHQIAAQALRAGEIIRRLRSLVRRQEPARTPVHANELIEELSTLTTSDARLHDVRLIFEPGTALPQVSVDSVQIQQVLLNLVRNAIEAMEQVEPERRAVRITTARAADGDLEISVADNGPGVDPKILDHLFNPFYTTKETGTGLGLAISRSIVTAHNGTLRYESPGSGGARFVLRLPAA